MPKNAIVIMFDSLQFNYVGCYGNDWIKTPNMDRLAREGALFENAYTEGLPTVPCRRSMHTGRYTLQKAGWVALSMEDTTIADLCWGRPIDTALVFDCPMYRLPKFGYTRGFDKVYFTHGHEGDDGYYEHDALIHLDPDDYFEESTKEKYLAHTGNAGFQANYDELTNYLREMQYWKGDEDRYVAKTIRKAIAYLEQVDRNKQFYLWIDSFDPHEPWNPPSVYTDQPCPYDPDYKGKDEFLPFADNVKYIYSEEQCRHVRMLYAELVTLCDKYLGVLMDAVRRLGFEENTLFMMVSDHGEPMGEGEHGHGIMRKCRPWPYEELSHIPVIVKGPGIKAGQRIKTFIQSCDVAPTVCDWLGIGVHPAMQGKSLLPVLFGETDTVRDYALAGYHPYSQAIFTEDWSYIHWEGKALSDATMAMNFYNESVDYSNVHITGGKGMFEAQIEGALADQLAKIGHPELAGKVTPQEAADFIRQFRMQAEGLSDAEQKYKANASLDGEAQWTCTPASTADVPEEDELYDRKADPFQLNNVIKQHPEIAQKLYMRLQDIMAELKNS